MNNSAIQHLKRLTENAGHNETTLAEVSGVPQSTINRIFSGETQNPRLSSLDKLAATFGLSWAQIEIDSASHIKEPAQHYNATKHTALFRTAPVLSIVRAGEFFESEENHNPHSAELWLPVPANAGNNTIALRIEGDSMTNPYPTARSYPEGAIIFVDPDKAFRNGSRVVARCQGEYTFKVYVEDSGKRYLKPLNPQYPTTEINHDTEIVGSVIATWIAE